MGCHLEGAGAAQASREAGDGAERPAGEGVKVGGALLILFLALAGLGIAMTEMYPAWVRVQEESQRAYAAALTCQEGDTFVCTRQYYRDCIAWRVCMPVMPGFGQQP